ncbi:unnamed protein product [Penicillium salamii]|uniref:Uncharacterized protein n=1 Tax=Penicillium salamii TaxID=1612424 RepID=A0A9W4NBB6_9EURO|nr:unnamed protein product [Penicillium salamii]CAG7997941.1 unnamed protein product [Penicillium salamii]CAG8069734.1 unnamed protein product [Penicillium salamii]CAG8077905.1 unnamed protein product [Penicillium salamii]CAG8354445.1 unnamed protein product [Penicillium salamii]
MDSAFHRTVARRAVPSPYPQTRQKSISCSSSPSRPDDELPASFIRYTMEWKVKVNNRSISEDTQQDLALTLSALWPLALRDKLYKAIEEKVARKRRVRSDDTSIVVSINERKQRDLKKAAVYNLMRCPSPSCHLGPHCWQDPHGKKHYQLRTHHSKRLVASVKVVAF